MDNFFQIFPITNNNYFQRFVNRYIQTCTLPQSQIGLTILKNIANTVIQHFLSIFSDCRSFFVYLLFISKYTKKLIWYQHPFPQPKLEILHFFFALIQFEINLFYKRNQIHAVSFLHTFKQYFSLETTDCFLKCNCSYP